MGETLKVETLKGDEIQRRGLNVGETIQPDTEVVVITFPPVVAGKTADVFGLSAEWTDLSRLDLSASASI